jgi:hypothetical protein
MTKTDAKLIAENLVQKADLKGYKAVFVEVAKRQPQPNDWTVLFNLYAPDNSLFDTPLIVIVNDATGEAKFFTTL